MVARLHSYGIQTGALKRGAQGPRKLGTDDKLTGNANVLFEKASRVVDTTAAGDSFNAGYLSAILRGQSEDEALLAGHRCSLRVIASKGAIIPLSDW